MNLKELYNKLNQIVKQEHLDFFPEVVVWDRNWSCEIDVKDVIWNEENAQIIVVTDMNGT